VHSLAYSFIFDADEFRLLQICEPAHSGYCQSGAGHCNCTDDDLQRIRLVLRKLSTMRINNPEDAEDLVQETLLTMVRKAPRIDLEKGMLIWAMGVLRKKVGNYYRKAQRYTSLDDQKISGNRAIHSPAALSPESHLHHAELRAMVDSVLGTLSPREREEIDLYLAGIQTSEIATLLHPERYQNIANWLHRGRKKLAKELSRHGYKRCGPQKRRRSRDSRTQSRTMMLPEEASTQATPETRKSTLPTAEYEECLK